MLTPLFKIFQSNGLRQSALLTVGNLLGTGLSAIALFFISRLLGPEKFGEFSVGFAIILIITKLNDLGFSTAIVKYGSSASSKEEKNYVFSYTLRVKFLITALLTIIGLSTIHWQARLLNFNSPEILFIAYTIGFVTVYYEQLWSILQAIHNFSGIVLINALQSGTKLIGALALFILNYNSHILAFALYTIGALVPLLFYPRLIPKWISLKVKTNVTKSPAVRKKLWRLVRHASVATISAGVIENVDILFVQRYLDSYETGLLSGAVRIALVFALIAYSISNVLNTRVARYKSKEHLAPYIKKSIFLMLGSFVAFIFFVPFAEPILTIILGNEYLPALPILIIVTAASFLAIASTPFIALFYSFELPAYFSVSGVLQLLIVVIGNAVFVPLYGLEAAAWTRLASRTFLFVFTMVLAVIWYTKEYVVSQKDNSSIRSSRL